MNDKRKFSDEQLNAFVDSQLGAQESEEILAAATTDAELGQRLCALRATKELVNHAYGRIPPARRRARRRGSLWSGALAAGLALAAGVLIGWQGHRTSQEGGEALATQGGLFAPQPARVLIHLDNSQTERMEQALDLAEAYLAKAGRARVEIVVNNSGLDLLREESTFHAERIARLAARHEMLAFVACGNAIARYRSAGLDVKLVPEARVERTAVEHIVDR
ncbi:MAG: hypothetical protein IT512_00590, partial [Rhodocyclaceae bacterium]|nr:hypothetical protein [Rhodocyclaceae bacterium]